jgi:cell division protein FtsB
MPRSRLQQPRPFFQRFFSSKISVIVEVIVLVVVTAAVVKEVVRKYQVQSDIHTLEQQAGALEQRNTELRGFITYLGSDSYKEEEARLKLGLQKPGESVVTVLGTSTDEQPTVSSAGTEQTTATRTTNPQQWWTYFLYHNKNNTNQ